MSVCEVQVLMYDIICFVEGRMENDGAAGPSDMGDDAMSTTSQCSLSSEQSLDPFAGG